MKRLRRRIQVGSPRLAAVPWYCCKCARRHEPDERILRCTRCGHQAFTLALSTLDWHTVVTYWDQRFLTNMRIGYV